MSVANATALGNQNGFRSLAFPLVGAGTGGLRAAEVERLMLDTLHELAFDGEIRMVRYKPDTPSARRPTSS